jgi:hypothetical protein
MGAKRSWNRKNKFLESLQKGQIEVDIFTRIILTDKKEWGRRGFEEEELSFQMGRRCLNEKLNDRGKMRF